MNLGQRNKVSVSGNMSSMTDLVFLLLIFFVILSTLVSNGVNVELPKAKGTNSVTAKMTVSIMADESYHVNGGAVAKSDLESILKVRMADSPDNVLYLQVDEAVPTGLTVELIGMAKANEWKVMLGAAPAKN
jgi:biopolymer transport protein ExbD